jgi:putative chitinase
MQLTEHFSLAEATVTSVKADNTPTPAHLENIKKTAAQLEKVREAVGNVPLKINSFYRSAAVNKAVGGSATSAHSVGYAVDFNAQGLSVADVCALIKKAGIKFDQLIDEKNAGGGTWVHISFDPRYRMQHLKMRVVNGKSTYTPA